MATAEGSARCRGAAHQEGEYKGGKQRDTEGKQREEDEDGEQALQCQLDVVIVLAFAAINFDPGKLALASICPASSRIGASADDGSSSLCDR